MQFQNALSTETHTAYYRNRDPYTQLQKLGSKYLNPGVYGTPSTYERGGGGAYYALLAPLSAGIVSGIDFNKPYLNKDLDMITGMFTERAFLETARIESLLGDMTLRYDLMNRNIKTLDYQICYVDSQIFQLPESQLGFFKDIDRTKLTLESTAMELEQQKLKEKTSAWKDISRLKSDLMECLKEYSAAQGSKAFLNTEQGGKNY